VGERIVVADRLASNGLALLRSTSGLDVIETVGKGPDALKDALLDAAALIVRSETKVTGDLMAAAPKLRIVARAGIGTDNIDLEEATRRGIPVLTAPGANSNSAAEHALALMLSLCRRIPAAAQSMAEGKWDRKQFEGTELRGKTLGILGLGRIGTIVAKIAQAFGMTVIALDPFVLATHALSLGVDLLPLETVLGRADVITLHIALTEDTRHLLNAERFGLMKKGMLIVNTASACGFTPQFAGLEELHETYGNRGLVVLGFPCNQFGAQDAGSNDEIAEFCQLNYGVSFPMMAKIDVNGAQAHPLYQWLTQEAPGLLGSKAIKWNFTKFLIGKDGAVLKRYAPTATPASLAKDIETALAA